MIFFCILFFMRLIFFRQSGSITTEIAIVENVRCFLSLSFLVTVIRLLLELSFRCLLSDSLLENTAVVYCIFLVDYRKSYTCSNVYLFWTRNSASSSLFREDLLEYLTLLFLLFSPDHRIAMAGKRAKYNRKFIPFNN